MADRKITALTELTAAVADDLLLVVDTSEAADADKNKKLKISSLLRNVEAGTTSNPSIGFVGSGSTGIYSVDSSTIGLAHNGTQTASLGFTTAGSVVQPRYSIGATEFGMSGTTDAPLHIRQNSADDAEAALVIESSDTSGSQGPLIEIRRKSPTVSDNDAIGAIKFTGNNDFGGSAATFETINYASIQATMVDITDTEEDGRLEFLTQDGTAGLQPAMFVQNKKVGIGSLSSGGTLVPDVELHVKSNSAGTALEVECTEVSAAGGADLVLYRHRNGAAGVADDVLSTIKFQGKESLTNDETYAHIKASIVDPDASGVVPQGKLEIVVDPARANHTKIGLVDDLISFTSPIALEQSTNVPAPVAANSPGSKGEIRWDNDYLYLCNGTGTSSQVNRWRRVALEANW